MSQSQQHTEQTRLLEPSEPQYVFGSSIARERKRKIKQFQCFLCATLLILVAASLITAIAFSLIMPNSDGNSTDSSNDSLPLPPQSTLVLFSNITWPINDKNIRNKNYSDFDKQAIDDALLLGQKALENKEILEEFVPSLPIQSPSYRHQKVMSTTNKSIIFSKQGYREEYSARHLLRNESAKLCFPYNSSIASEYCTTMQIVCNKYQKYRTYDGTCNNLRNRLFGVAYQPFRRALPADYADGISKPRQSFNGTLLPSARTVSLEVHRPYYRNDPKFSVMLAVWGQFLDHDITATALSLKANGSSISCCENELNVTSPECFPVILDPFDPFTEYNRTCMEFVRSAPAATCCLGPREQLNQVTSYIDGSVVYGIDEEKVVSLREMKNGRLTMYVTPDNRTLLPPSEDMFDGCNREEEKTKGRYCFATGDVRANENVHLTTMHLLWARHHNKLAADLLKVNNTHWDDEILFQESRKILAAQMQHITYAEFLPILLGEDRMKELDLFPKKSGYFKKYNYSINPNIANNFATAAFRFAHSLIPGLMKLLANDSSSPEFIQMHKMLFDPFTLYNPEGVDETLRGAMGTSIEASDSYFSNEVKSHLFERTAETIKQPKLCGLDLVSLNIQRGRDHGLPGYIFWRDHCGLEKINDFDDLYQDMDRKPVEDMKAVYRDVKDIDLYTGALSEKPLNGSILGPTLTCLIMDQFMRIKFGDRFWYENPKVFTPNQLKEIRKSTLASIICNNSDNLDLIQLYVMKRSSNQNKIIPCSQIPKINFSHWKEELNINIVKMTRDKFKIITKN